MPTFNPQTVRRAHDSSGRAARERRNHGSNLQPDLARLQCGRPAPLPRRRLFRTGKSLRGCYGARRNRTGPAQPYPNRNAAPAAEIPCLRRWHERGVTLFRGVGGPGDKQPRQTVPKFRGCPIPRIRAGTGRTGTDQREQHSRENRANDRDRRLHAISDIPLILSRANYGTRIANWQVLFLVLQF